MTCKGCGNSYNLFKGNCEYCGTYVDGMERSVRLSETLKYNIDKVKVSDYTFAEKLKLISKIFNDQRYYR